MTFNSSLTVEGNSQVLLSGPLLRTLIASLPMESVLLPHALTDYLTGSSLREKEFILAHSLR